MSKEANMIEGIILFIMAIGILIGVLTVFCSAMWHFITVGSWIGGGATLAAGSFVIGVASLFIYTVINKSRKEEK